MNLSRTVVQRPVSVLMLFGVVAGIGVGAFRDMPIDLLPAFEIPSLSVSTSYPGAGPAEIERLVTDPLERALSGIGGLDSMNSSSSEGSSRITLRFAQDADLVKAANDVRDALGSARGRLPSGAGEPRIQRFDPNARPVMNLAFTGGIGADRLRAVALDVVQPALEQVDGVGQAAVNGGRDSYVRIEVDRVAMESYGLTLTEVARALSALNAESSGGAIRQGDLRYLVSTGSAFASLQDVADATIGSVRSAAGSRLSAAGPRPVRLSEIAAVSLATAEETQSVTIDGLPGVYVNIVKESAANSVRVADAVRARIEAIRPLLPAGTDLRVIDDTTTSIRASLDEVSRSLLIGGALTMAVLFLFLRNVRAALIIGFSIPVSLLATVTAMRLGGLTLNTVSLSGLILGIGMIVDSSIVVLENVHRKRAGGLPIEDAAIIGADEMIGSIVGSALTTVCVFAPVLFFRRGLGNFSFLIGDIAFTVIVAILSSLATAVLLVPVLASTYLPLLAENERFRVLKFLKPVDDAFERGFLSLEGAYARLLRAALRHRASTIAVVLSVFAAALSFAPRLPFIFSPSTAEDSVSVSLRLRQGTVYGTTKATAEKLAGMIAENVDGIQALIVNVGGGASNSHSAQISIRLPPVGRRTVTPDDAAAYVRSISGDFPGARISVGGNRGRQISGTSQLTLVFASADHAAALAAAQAVESLARERFPEIVEPSVSVPEASASLSAVVDPALAADLGVSAAAASSELRAVLGGASAGTFRQGGKEYDLRLEFPPGERSTLADLERAYVKSSSGARVPLASFVRLERASAPVSIQREDGRRTVRLTASLAQGFEADEVEPRFRAAVTESVALPDGVSLRWAGEAAAIRETGVQIGLVLAVAVALVFAVMAGQFESFSSPFVIFSALPMMGIGVVGIHALTGQPVSMFSLLGLVLLAGIAVNNGIVLVDYANLLRVRGLDRTSAAAESGRHRLKPILITTATTIVGMAPLAFFPGEGARITQPVALTIVGGLVSSTLVTLFFVPVLYSLLSPARRARRADPAADFAKWAAERTAAETPAALAAGEAGSGRGEPLNPAPSPSEGPGRG